MMTFLKRILFTSSIIFVFLLTWKYSFGQTCTYTDFANTSGPETGYLSTAFAATLANCKTKCNSTTNCVALFFGNSKCWLFSSIPVTSPYNGRTYSQISCTEDTTTAVTTTAVTTTKLSTAQTTLTSAAEILSVSMTVTPDSINSSLSTSSTLTPISSISSSRTAQDPVNSTSTTTPTPFNIIPSSTAVQDLASESNISSASSTTSAAILSSITTQFVNTTSPVTTAASASATATSISSLSLTFSLGSTGQSHPSSIATTISKTPPAGTTTPGGGGQGSNNGVSNVVDNNTLVGLVIGGFCALTLIVLATVIALLRLYSKTLGSKSSRRSLEDRDFTDTSARQEYMTRTWPRHFTPRFSTEYNLNYPYN